MSALICGSMAFDTIMAYPDAFKNHIMPDKVHMLNVCFEVPELRREFGGTAGNIAYNLKLLGAEGLPMATVGQDFGPYAAWMDQQGITRQYLKEIAGAFTAQAYITTDKDDNQITAFHPGAMAQAHQQKVPADEGVSIGILAPDGREAMLQHAEQFHEAGIPFIFDPGQGLPLFDGKELLHFIELSRWAVVNDYESQMLERKTGLTAYQIAEKLDALIVTWGAKGSVIYTDGGRVDVPPVMPSAVVDPTGCGDAYRAGLLYGLMNMLDWQTTGHIASLMGSMCIAARGTQNHKFNRAQFDARYEVAFGAKLEMA
jgi:adenosine kinase